MERRSEQAVSIFQRREIVSCRPQQWMQSGLRLQIRWGHKHPRGPLSLQKAYEILNRPLFGFHPEPFFFFGFACSAVLTALQERRQSNKSRDIFSSGPG